jgi:hypothetical protein
MDDPRSGDLRVHGGQGHSRRMCFRELTIRVLGRFPNEEYARLAYLLGHCLTAAGVQDRVIFLTDGDITGSEMDVPYGTDEPLVPRRPRD